MALTCGQCSLRTFLHTPEPEIATHQDPCGAVVQSFADHEHLVHRDLKRIGLTRYVGHGDGVGPRPADGRGGRPGRPRQQHVPGREAKHRLAEYHVEDDRAVGRVGLAAWLIVTVGAVVSGGSITR